MNIEVFETTAPQKIPKLYWFDFTLTPPAQQELIDGGLVLITLIYDQSSIIKQVEGVIQKVCGNNVFQIACETDLLNMLPWYPVQIESMYRELKT